MHNYKNLKIWQKSREVVKEVFLATRDFPLEEKYGLVSQIMRCSYSIPSNIAEGSARGSNKEFVRFLAIALGSAYELETQLILAYDVGYLNETTYQKLTDSLQEIQRMIYAFKNNL